MNHFSIYVLYILYKREITHKHLIQTRAFWVNDWMTCAHPWTIFRLLLRHIREVHHVSKAIDNTSWCFVFWYRRVRLNSEYLWILCDKLLREFFCIHSSSRLRCCCTALHTASHPMSSSMTRRSAWSGVPVHITTSTQNNTHSSDPKPSEEHCSTIYICMPAVVCCHKRCEHWRCLLFCA